MQTHLYNKKLKCAPVNICDRILLANKGECGKRKIADKSEGRIYIVTGMNNEVHTFRIRNSVTGDEQVHNLIMPVNFLPLQNEVPEVDTKILL